MKLLLTSNGLANKSIISALSSLLEKPMTEANVAFIPTAANVEERDKKWLIDDLVNIKNQNFNQIDIVDISALPKDVWLPRLEHADILLFSGGHTIHLIHWVRKSGLADVLPELLKTKIFVGISAGSIITAPTLAFSGDTHPPFDYHDSINNDKEGLNLVNFYIRPHLNSPDFPKSKKEYIGEIAKEVTQVVYGLDDQSAIKVIRDTVEIISEGETTIFNN